jgi:hypothetical protein
MSHIVGTSPTVEVLESCLGLHWSAKFAPCFSALHPYTVVGAKICKKNRKKRIWYTNRWKLLTLSHPVGAEKQMWNHHQSMFDWVYLHYHGSNPMLTLKGWPWLVIFPVKTGCHRSPPYPSVFPTRFANLLGLAVLKTSLKTWCLEQPEIGREWCLEQLI